MATVKYSKIFELVRAINDLDLTKKDTLSEYGQEFAKSLGKIAKRYNTRVKALSVDHASKDEYGDAKFVDAKAGIYAMTPENTKLFDKAVDALEDETVELKPNICPNIGRVKKLKWQTQKALNGWLFNYTPVMDEDEPETQPETESEEQKPAKPNVEM